MGLQSWEIPKGKARLENEVKFLTLLFIFALTFSLPTAYILFELNFQAFQVALIFKDIILGFIAVFAAFVAIGNISARKISAFGLLFLSIIFLNLIYCLSSPAGWEEKILNIRRNLAFIIIVFSFSELGIGFRRPANFMNILKPFIFVVGAFGLIELCFSQAFWDGTLEITRFTNSIQADPFKVGSIAESGRFYSWDFYPILGYEIRRMVSMYLEPTTLAAFLAAALCLSIAIKSTGAGIRSFSIILLGALTMSKFFLISIPFAYLLFAFARILRRRHYLIFFMAIVLAAYLFSMASFDHGALAHVRGISSLPSLLSTGKIFGYGLGVAGNYSSYDASIGVGTESGLGNLAAQFGLLSVLYVLFFNSIYVRLLNYYRRSGDVIVLSAIVALFLWTISLILSASSLGFSGNAFIALLIGSGLFRANNPEAETFSSMAPARRPLIAKEMGQNVSRTSEGTAHD